MWVSDRVEVQVGLQMTFSHFGDGQNEQSETERGSILLQFVDRQYHRWNENLRSPNFQTLTGTSRLHLLRWNCRLLWK